MKTKNLAVAVSPVSRLQKASLADLAAAVATLAALAKRSDVKEPKSVDTGVKRVLELRLAIAVEKAGNGHKTRQSLVEALLQSEVCDGVGLPYEEILHLVTESFPDSETTMNCIRWYASKLKKRVEAEGKSLPTRPMSA